MKTVVQVFALLVALTGPSVGTARAAGPPPTDEVRRFADVITKAVAAGNADAIAALYAPTAVLLAPDGSVAARREGIRAAYAGNQALGPNKMEFTQVSVDGDDTQAVALWVWTLTISPPGKPVIKNSGRSMVYLKHIPEGWQIVLDMYQSQNVAP